MSELASVMTEVAVIVTKMNVELQTEFKVSTGGADELIEEMLEDAFQREMHEVPDYLRRVTFVPDCDEDGLWFGWTVSNDVGHVEEYTDLNGFAFG